MIPVVHTREELAALGLKDAGDPLVLVPTMGSLHEGHLSLVREAKRYGKVVVSIFVNPTQFGPNEDYARYPRDLDADLALLDPLGPDAVFAPAVEEMYASANGVRIEPGERAAPLCGARRAGHFSGVLTVVAKLFHMIEPEAAVFGRKDAQQCLVIQEMVRDLAVPVRLIDAPTVREPDGLAMSSRNRYLSAADRERALCIWRALNAARRAVVEGERRREELEDVLALHLAVADAVDYAEIRSLPELTTTDTVSGSILMAIAAYVGETRLIDNMALRVDGNDVAEIALLGDETP